MLNVAVKYKLSNYAILAIVLLSGLISFYFKWNYAGYPINFMDGDAKDYYSALVSVFIHHDFFNQQGQDWFLLKTSGGIVNVHPIGVSVLLLPFFILGYGLAVLLGFPLDGISFPFQLSASLGALGYAVIGLIYLKKLFQLHQIRDKISALVILFVFFGTNLLNYTLSEAVMSHVYSFCLITVFLYHSSTFVLFEQNKSLVFSFLILGLILLVRPNNIFIVLSVFIWFKSFKACQVFFKNLIKNKIFHLSILFTSAIVLIQSLIWWKQSGAFFHDTYKADGFYWLHPQLLKMLFGFDGGFFIYTPLCLFWMFGLFVVFKQNKFSFFAFSFLLLLLFYFFSSYWAYTYFDGLGIRVLIDYYSLFAFLGAKVFSHFAEDKLILNSLVTVSAILMIVNLIYCYQGNRNILLRSGMNFNKWKYVFLRTGENYQNCLGGSSDLKPFSKHQPDVSLSKEFALNVVFDYSGKDYGVVNSFDSLGFNSNRIHLKIKCGRKEFETNSSDQALICVSLEDKYKNLTKSYFHFKLNETPASSCCSEKQYEYSANMNGDFRSNNRLSVFIWNIKKQAFQISQFSVQIFNYNYQIN